MKLQSHQQDIVKKYAEAVNVGASVSIWNDQYPAFEEMVLGLSNCQMLGSADVLDLAIDHAVDLRQQLTKDAKENAPESASIAVAGRLAQQLMSFLESLPRAYEMRISLPSFPAWGSTTYDLAPDIRIVCDNHVETSSGNRLAQLVNLPSGTEAKNYGAKLVFNMRGYASETTGSATVGTGLGLAKLCAFLFLETDSVIMGRNTSLVKATVTVSDVLSGKQSEVSIPEKFAFHLGSLKPNKEKLRVRDSSTGQLAIPTSRYPASNLERIEAFTSLLKPSSNALKHYRKSENDFEQLAAAIEWHQDSVVAEDQTIAYLAACIGLESIFGEKDMSEMSKRLEDRYAFLLGNDREDRKKLAQEYREVLRIRGQLVHARVKKLPPRDYKALETAREMLRKTIAHELTSFTRDD